MDIPVQSVVVEVVPSDLPRTLEFYRLPGLNVPNPDEPHVEVQLPIHASVWKHLDGRAGGSPDPRALDQVPQGGRRR